MNSDKSDRESNINDVSLSQSRACDQCRMRKVRCDRGSPCKTCKTNGIPCHTSERKERTRRQRVIISGEYERKIDRIESRLATILQALQGPNGFHLPQTSLVAREESVSLSNISQATGSDTSWDETTAGFEGSSAMSAHTSYARAFLSNLIETNPSTKSNPELVDVVSSLRVVVNNDDGNPIGKENMPETQKKSSPETCRTPLELPPVDAVLSALQMAREKTTFTITWLSSIVTMDTFTELCKTVYFDAGAIPSTSILFNATCYYLFLELQQTGNSYAQFVLILRKNLDMELKNLRLCMTPTFESVQALVVGAIYAIDMSKPSMAWNLISYAINMCQTLGYHRSSSLENDSIETKRSKLFLFYHAYTLDKSMSLRLGRASTIRDSEIILAIPAIEEIAEPWDQLFWYSVQQASIQGRVYEDLYSPEALVEGIDVQVARANSLANEISLLYLISQKIDLRRNAFHSPEICHLIKLSDKVVYYTTLTLIYRAISSSSKQDVVATFSSHCIEAARFALCAYLDCVKLFSQDLSDHFLNGRNNIWSGFLNWTILQIPFVPFVVLFCYIVSTGSMEDLSTLRSFVSSLNSSKENGVEKLRHVCHGFLEAAESYISANKQSVPQLYSENKSNAWLRNLPTELGPYLNTTGLPPITAGEQLSTYLDLDDWYLENW